MLACVGKVERRDMEDVVALLHESVQTCQQLLHKAGSANPGPSRALPLPSPPHPPPPNS